MSKTCFILLADGFEEIEALTPADILRRMDIDARLVGVSSKLVKGAHGIELTADATLNRLKADTPDAVLLPGGMPGAKNLDSSPFVRELLLRCRDRGALICAICAAPMVLGRLGLLEGRRATCYPGFEEHLRGAELVKEPLVTDGRFITANGPGAAAAFGFAAGTALRDEVSAKFTARAMMF